MEIRIQSNGKSYQLTDTKSPGRKGSEPDNADKIPNCKLLSPGNWRMVAQALKLKALDEAAIKKEVQSKLKKQALTLSLIKLRTPAEKAGYKGQGAGAAGGESPSQGSEPLQSKHVAVEQPEQSSGNFEDNKAKQSDAPSDGGQDNEHCETAGCPISMVSGEELLQLGDFALPGPLPLNWQRTYRSSHTRDSGLGCGWTHTGSAYLLADTLGNLTYFDDEGRGIPLKMPQIGQRSKYIPECLSLDRLSENTFLLKKDGEWNRLFTRPSRQSLHFRLTEIRHPHYQAAKNLLGVMSEERGYVIQLRYNEHNRVVRYTGNWGKSLLLQRDRNGRVQQVFLCNDISQKNKLIAEYDYSDTGDLVAHRNAKGVGEKYRYENHLIRQRTLKTGFNFYFEWDGETPTARCIHNWGDRGIYDYRFEWNPDKNTSQTQDSRGYIKRFKYNEYGQITEEVDNEGHIHQYAYSRGRKKSYTDPNGNTTHYLYTPENQPAGYSDALGNSVVLGYFKGKLRNITDKDKTRWQREYNSQGQLSALINPLNQQVQYEYNQHGLIQRVTQNGLSTHYRWSEQGELISVTDPRGNIQKFQYDDWGQIVSAEWIIGGKTSAGTVQYQYSSTGMIEQVTAANGDETHYSYNDNDQLIRFSDPRGRATEFFYDGLSQVVERVDSEGQRLRYQYDSERNLIALINENGERYTFEYDGNERLIQETGFDGRIQQYEYDPAGHLIRHVDAGEVETEFERDALGQLQTKISRLLKGGNKEYARFAYDAKGRITETYNQHQYLQFKYNALGQLIQEHHSDLNPQKERIPASMVDIHYRIDSTGLRSGMALPDGQNIEYEYDNFGQLTRIHRNGRKLSEIERDLLGREVLRQQGALLTQSKYDPHGRLLAQHSVNQQNKTSPIHREYGYDQFGNLSSLTDGGEETRYIYDMVNRLKRVEGASPETFAFDPASNLIGMGEGKQKPKGQAKGNRLIIQGDRKFSYDARGNLIKENRGKNGKLETTYEYNAQNQLVKLTRDGQNTVYQYDPLGRRIKKQDAFGSTAFLWAGDQLIQEQRNNDKKTYIYEPASFKPAAMVQNDQVYHYHLNHLGTPHELTNEEGQIVWKARYRTYGNVALQEVEEVENPIRFQGQYFDEESGLHYNRHRYYDPSSGQFTTQDPIGLLGGVNNYQYVPNPTAWVDPFGLACKENSWNQFQKDSKGHFANSTEASKAYQRMKEVAAMGSRTEKLNRPNPNSYLPQSYIDTHIQRFDAEGAGFIAIQGWMENPDYPSLPPRKFVGLRSEMDSVIKKYEDSGNNWKVLRDELSLGNVDLSNESIAYVVIEPDDHRFSYDIPTGREAGAYEGEWIPGGKTKGGTTEAALVGSEGVVHDNDVNNLVKQFPGSKKIK